MSDIMKLALEDSVLLKKGVTQTIENETKNQRGGFLAMLLGTLGASLLGNMLAGWNNQISVGFFSPSYPLTNFEMQKYYQNKPKFKGVYSRNNLPNTEKTGVYVVYLDELEEFTR